MITMARPTRKIWNVDRDDPVGPSLRQEAVVDMKALFLIPLVEKSWRAFLAMFFLTIVVIGAYQISFSSRATIEE